MGKLLVIEGIDGIGKTIATRNLSQYCQKYHISHTLMKFPSYAQDTYNGIIKHYLQNAPGKPTYLESMILILSYAGDRYRNKHKLQQALDNHDLVILDRFVASNIAYQVAHFTNISMQKQYRDFIYHLEHYKLGLPIPDLYVLLNGNTTLASQNLKQANKDLDSFECNLNYLQRVQNQYLTLAHMDNKTPWRSSPWLVVEVQDTKNCLRSSQAIAKQIWQEMKHI